MKKLVRPILGFLAPVIVAGFLFLAPVTANADYSVQSGVNSAHGNGQPADLFGNSGIFTSVTNILLFIVGILSVIMLIIGGLRYILSGGNATAVTAAKNTILYAIVGLVVAILAYAIIHFVIGAIGGNMGGGGGTDV
jgi:hypothetical protein